MKHSTEQVRASAAPASVQDVLARLQERIGPQKYNAWFRHGARIAIEDGHVKVSVPNTFAAHWVEGHYVGEIGDVADELTGRRRPVIVTVDPSLAEEVRRNDYDRQADMVTRVARGRARRPAPAPVPLRHTMDSFVVGQSNQLAHSAALALCERGKPLFNPLFVHGPCGVGKTHLLQGICDRYAKRQGADEAPAWRYVTAEQFTNEFVIALRQKKVDQFRDRYRHLDLLAIDDVHFLAAKKATQAEFLHTFNAIQEAGRRVVMASDAHPHLVGEMNEQLTSRFVAGMVVKIDAPDPAMRLELVRRKARRLDLHLTADVLQYVARHVRGSVRELEGTLVKLTALSALEGKITVSLVADALSDHLARTDSVLTLGDIENAVAAFFAVTPAELHSTRRTKTVATARMVAMYLARRHTQMSYPEIGKHMGKNHSTVVLAVQRLDKRLDANADLEWNAPTGKRSMNAQALLEMLTAQIT